MYVDYVSANTVRVVHSANIIKFGDLATNKKTFSLTNWPGIDIRPQYPLKNNIGGDLNLAI